MSILLISETFPPRVGGTGRWFWELYRRFPPGRCVLAVGRHPGQDELDRTHQLQVERIPLTLRDPGVCSLVGLQDYWKAYQALRPILRLQSIDQVHAGRCVPEGWLALWLK